jgi:UDP-N-acetylmuramoyl-tripeptide--D-alanyl-D-alanine ligase
MTDALPPLWTGADIAAATGGALSSDFTANGVAFDSREILAGDLFVALRGAQTDGHRFVGQALARGATGILCSEPVEAPHVLVPDSLAALVALGAAARARTLATVVGVTGSVGKTGVKEALRRSFQRMEPDSTHWSVKSYNNHTGVPLSLARMPADTRFAVFEMGMNHAGEIAALTRQVRPHVALITWVAPVHIENFADEEGVADAKAEIFEGLEPGGTAIIPADNRHASRLLEAARAHAARVIRFGSDAGADVRVLEAEPTATGTRLTASVLGETLHLTVGMAGRHWIGNALAVLAAVHAAGGDVGEAALALAEFRTLEGRGARYRLAIEGGEATLIDESYNANPASMAAALEVLGAVPATRRIAILGSMKELGAHAARMHAGLAGPIAAAGVSELALIGPEMEALKVDGAAHLPDAGAALSWALAMLRPGDVVLVKGSNSLGLGALVSALVERLSGDRA